ncbi:glycosyl transferase family 14, partial [Lactiplantibacillus garii]
VVDNRCLIYKAFGKGRAIDEMFMQTLLVNSKFKNTLADAKIGNLRFIEWGSARSPKEFTDVQDGMKLLQSDKIFARKFNMEKGKNLIFYVIRNRDK